MNIVNKKIMSIVIVSLFVLSMIAGAMPVSAKNVKINVYEGQSIQEAIDWANAGCTVVVHAGTYHQKVFVNKPLTLMGKDAIIDLDGVNFPSEEPFNAGIYVDAPYVTVSGFTIRNVPYYPPQVLVPYAFAIRFVGSASNGVIENNIVESPYQGIGITSYADTADKDYAEITNVEVRNNQISAVYGLWIVNVNDVEIRNNQVTAKVNPQYRTGLPAAISVAQFTRNELTPTIKGASIRNNIVCSEGTGISISGNTNAGGIAQVEIRNNVVTMKPLTVEYVGGNPVAAINVGNAPSAVVKNNFVQAKTSLLTVSSVPVVGIRLLGISNDAIVEKNEITSDYTGIRINGPSGVNIQKNLICAAVNSIDTTGSASNFVIKKNTLTAKTNWLAKAVYGGMPMGIKLSGSYMGGLIDDNEIDTEYYGIWIDGVSQIQVIDNVVKNAILAVQINNAPNIFIGGNTLEAKANIDYPDGFPNGISLSGSFSGCSIVKNSIESADRGIWIYGQSNIEISNNLITAVTVIEVHDSPSVKIRSNTIFAKNLTDQIRGIGIILRKDIDFSGGVIENNDVYSEFNGISLDRLTDIKVLDNQVHVAAQGIFLVSPSDVTVKGNVVFSDGEAITVNGASINLVITENELYAGGHGINLIQMWMTNPVVTGNIIYSGFYGINLNLISEATIQNNEIHIVTNSRPIKGGIVIFGSISSEITGNIISGDFNSGISLLNSGVAVISSTNTIEGNVITGVYKPNDAGIRLFPGTTLNTVMQNIITNVNQPILDMGTGNIIIP